MFLHSRQIRESFLDFFQSRKHVIMDSAPIVSKNDPSLMFVNAGMNQFKDIFLGNQIAKNLRVANSQRCLRVSGKHNDLDEVGVDDYHHTMFEMLGNWSFGDYFKKEAIHWAWEWLTEVIKLDADRIYVTIFDGEPNEGLTKDVEAEKIWSEILPQERILVFGKKDNFWEMGALGPCGPCSEIHYDSRPQEEIQKINGSDLVNKNHPQVIEIWNLVFIQYNRLISGKLEKLKQKHIDTGMGLERLTRVVQGVHSNYETDLFLDYLNAVSNITGILYTSSDSKQDIAMRVIADHIRALCFTIADGTMPSNIGAGYVVRRILRRAVRYYFSFLDQKSPLIFQLVDVWANQFRDIYFLEEEVKKHIREVILSEEMSFLKTIDSGLNKIQFIMDSHKNGLVSGKEIFKLYDTYGFPVDLSAMILRENNLEMNYKEYDQELQIQKNRSRTHNDAVTTHVDWVVLMEGNSNFVGYENLEKNTKILRYATYSTKEKTLLKMVLEENPFYAEAGGQRGDVGVLSIGEKNLNVLDTIIENESNVIITEYISDLSILSGTVFAKVDDFKRMEISKHHTATHLLNASLQNVLGNHVKQKGSYLNENYLRLDFNHSEKISKEQMEGIEKMVNTAIIENHTVTTEIVPREEALKKATTAVFGEKYPDMVRLVCINENKNFSVELCGGTHVKQTGMIGFFKMVKLSSIGSGIKRIEAKVSQAALEYVNEKLNIIEDINEILKQPKDIALAIKNLSKNFKELSKNFHDTNQYLINELKKNIENNIHHISGYQVYIEMFHFSDIKIIQALARELISNNKLDLVCLGVKGNNNNSFFMLKNKAKNLDCHTFVKKYMSSTPHFSSGGNSDQCVFNTDSSLDKSQLKTIFEKYIA